ncbi:MAG TPA: helicase-associated domain-containing protein [Planctomycetota bacterium]|nr:helicase-associated domain-containing protein [Planctomycetota bacterium]
MKDDAERAERAPRAADRNGSAPKNGTASVRHAVAERPESELRDLFRFWSGGAVPEAKGDPEVVREQVVRWMTDPEVVAQRVPTLGKRLGLVVELLLAGRGYGASYAELSGARTLSYLSDYDLEACLSALKRNALLVEVEGNRFDAFGERRFALPVEVGDGLREQRRAEQRGVFDAVTLRGWLDRVYSDPERAPRTSPQRLRELYKLYSDERACVARIERLPEGVRELVEKAILEFGGILPKQLFERLSTDLTHWNGRRWALILEQSLVGTVRPLDLSRFGIDHDDETLLVFNEVALAWFRKVAVPGDPDAPHEELSLGVDLLANVTRFLAFLHENDVRYTLRGEIFKTTEKRILQHLIPNPGRELKREEVLQFIFQFCKHAGLVEGTGERTLGVTSQGFAWSDRPLQEKLQGLLEYALEEPPDRGDRFHQLRLRRFLIRMLKRIEPGVWYDLMYLPFVARNQYLASLDELEVAEHFAERVQKGRAGRTEDVQRLAWELARWARRRLYLMGLIDLGYDSARRPVALRLRPAGARLLGYPEASLAPDRTAVGSLVVTPDFEVVLFPSGDDSELVHDLDRFCVREKADELLHFRIQQEAVVRALVHGMPLRRILEVLEINSRTPVPQNVSFSITDWARRAGLMRLGADLVLACDDADTLRRVQSDPGVRGYVKERLGEDRLRLSGRVTPRRMRGLLRDLGYLVELVG